MLLPPLWRSSGCLSLIVITSACTPVETFRFELTSAQQPLQFMYTTWFMGFDDYEPLRETPVDPTGTSVMQLAETSGITSINVSSISLYGPYVDNLAGGDDGPPLVGPISLSWLISSPTESCLDSGRELARIDLPAGTRRVAWSDVPDPSHLLSESAAAEATAANAWLLSEQAFSACLTATEAPSGGAFDFNMTFAWRVGMTVEGDGHPCGAEEPTCAP